MNKKGNDTRNVTRNVQVNKFMSSLYKSKFRRMLTDSTYVGRVLVNVHNLRTAVDLPSQSHPLLVGLWVEPDVTRSNGRNDVIDDHRVAVAVSTELTFIRVAVAVSTELTFTRAVVVSVHDVIIRDVINAVGELVGRHPLRMIIATLRGDRGNAHDAAQISLDKLAHLVI